MPPPITYLVVPCYNEEEVLPETLRRLTAVLERLHGEGRVATDSRILPVDDGSKDKTWSIIEQSAQQNPWLGGVKLSRNCGHQNALLAGLMFARDRCDCAISLDADLQDDVEAVGDFLDAFAAGHEVVYGVRKNRATDSAFKRGTAQGFYRLMRAMGADTVYNHADYRLLSRRAIEALGEFREVNLFLRGVVPLVGFSSTTVEYERHERFAGESKYPLKKMVSFAVEGITSFSVRPLQLILALGLLVSLLSVGGLLYALVSKLSGSAVPGWTATMFSIWLLGGIQLICVSVVGAYVGKIYQEVKGRPKYFVEKTVTVDN